MVLDLDSPVDSKWLRNVMDMVVEIWDVRRNLVDGLRVRVLRGVSMMVSKNG